jgi:TorA maturation chaperone TorD
MLRPMPIEPVPPKTARVARAAFPKGNRYLRLADELDTLFTDEAFGALFPTHGQPACPPGGSRWSPSSSSRRGSPTAKRRMPCGVASIGNTPCAWS